MDPAMERRLIFLSAKSPKLWLGLRLGLGQLNTTTVRVYVYFKIENNDRRLRRHISCLFEQSRAIL